MTIGYSTHWPKSMGPEYAGKPNFFPQKIIKGIPLEKWGKSAAYSMANDFRKECGYVRDYDQLIPKLHTFREDPQDRWKVGMKIHPVINNRTKNRFQFAPELKVKGIQKIEIVHYRTMVELKVDRAIWTANKNVKGEVCSWQLTIEKIAKNDGFDSVEQFFAWFNTDFNGKIIHWTNLKY